MMEKTAEYYDKLASVYDEATGQEGRWTPPSFIYERIKKYLSKESMVLDLGVGTGKSIQFIYESDQYKAIVGVDVSDKMLNVCRENYPSVEAKLVQSVSEIENLETRFDVIISSGVLEFVENLQEALVACGSVLRKGGVFAFTYEPIIHNHPIQKYGASETVSSIDSEYYVDGFYTYRRNPSKVNLLLKNNGYVVVTDEEFVSYEKGGEKIIYHLVVVYKV